MKFLNYIKSGKTLTIVAKDNNGKKVVKQFNDASSEWAEALKYIKAKKPEKLVNLLTKKSAVKTVVNKKGVSENRYKGAVVPDSLVELTNDSAEAGVSKGIVALLKRLKKNPSENSKAQLERWITTNGVTVLPDGRFVVYKGVATKDGHFVSQHDMKTRHDLGKPVTLDRDKCDDDPNSECGSGLHSASWDKVKEWYPHLTIVEIFQAPEDVVSVPHAGTKIRACKYFVSRVVKSREEIQEGHFASETGKVENVTTVETILIGGDKLTIPSKVIFAANLKGKASLFLNLRAGNVTISRKADSEDSKEVSVLGEGTLRIRTGTLKKHLKITGDKFSVKSSSGEITLTKPVGKKK